MHTSRTTASTASCRLESHSGRAVWMKPVLTFFSAHPVHQRSALRNGVGRWDSYHRVESGQHKAADILYNCCHVLVVMVRVEPNPGHGLSPGSL